MKYQQNANDLLAINNHNFQTLSKAEVEQLTINGSTFESLQRLDMNRLKQQNLKAKHQLQRQQRNNDSRSIGNTYYSQEVYNKGIVSEEGARRFNSFMDNKEHHELNNSGPRTVKQMRDNIQAMKAAKAKRENQ
ncbi:hypothetical protein THIOSC15_2700002 [uncultured Thiomicrorhabdus sp.]|jgi:hypothetical protein